MNKRDTDCFPGLKDGEAENIDIWADKKKLDISVLRKLPDDVDTTDLGRHFEERTLSMQVVGIWATYK